MKKEKMYWKNKLNTEYTPVSWHLDYPRNNLKEPEYTVYEFNISGELYSGIIEISRNSGLLVYVILMSSMAVCLSKYHNQSIIVLGSPAERGVLNSFPLFIEINKNIIVRDFLDLVRRELQTAYQHQDYPLSDLIKEMGLVKEKNRFSLFNILLSLEDHHAPVPDLKLDTSIFFKRENNCITGRVHYNSLLFKADSVEFYIHHLKNILQNMLKNTGNTVGQLKMMPESELLSRVNFFNRTQQEYPFMTCIHYLFEEQAAKQPEHVALVYGDNQVTFQGLNEKANQLAHYIISNVKASESLIGILIPRSLEMVVAVLAVLKSGRGYIPLNPEYPVDYLKYLIDDSSVKTILVHIDAQISLKDYGLNTIALQGNNLLWGSQSKENPDHYTDGDDLAYVIYTSGTTGKPKGIMIQHKSAVNLALGLEEIIFKNYGFPLRISLNAPLSFDVSVKQILQLLHGFTLYIIPESARRDGVEFLDYLAEHKIQILDSTPSHLKMLIGSGLFERENLCLQAALIGGEAIGKELWEMIISQVQYDFYNGYGPTECTVTATKTLIRKEDRLPHIGKPIPNVKVYILDESGNLADIGMIGELYIGGAGVGNCYLNRPELTAERFLPDPYNEIPGARMYKTGDLGYFRRDGNIVFCGRNDHQVKVRGYRIELGEIEYVMKGHPGVKDALVRVKKIDDDNRLIAYWIKRDNTLTIGDFKKYLAGKLPDFMVPSHFIKLESIPLTPHGKVNEQALPLPERFQIEPGNQAPETENEKIIAEIWKEALKVKQVGANDNFFDIGGYSLLLYKIRRRIEKALHIRLSTLELFDNPTISAIASLVAKKKDHLPLFEQEKIDPDNVTITSKERAAKRLDFLSGKKGRGFP